MAGFLAKKSLKILQKFKWIRINFHLKNSKETSGFLQFEVSDTKRIAKTRSSTATAIPFTHFCIGYWSCHPKKVLDNDWETSASSIIIAFFRRNCICKNWIPVLSAHPRNGGTTTLWKTSKRAIPQCWIFSFSSEKIILLLQSNWMIIGFNSIPVIPVFDRIRPVVSRIFVEMDSPCFNNIKVSKIYKGLLCTYTFGVGKTLKKK